MPNFHVVIDTNIYHKDPTRSKLPFKALERLCKSGVVQLHVPYIVEREFQTKLVENTKDKLESTLKGLENLIPHSSDGALVAQMQSLHKELQAKSGEVISNAEGAIVEWAKAVGAVRHPISSDHAKAAFEAYFQGAAPLTSPKVRSDIPDAFIFQTIIELAQTATPLVVISADGKIADASQAIDKVTVYKSLGEFIGSEAIQKEILHLDVVENLPVICSALAAYEADSHEIAYVVRNSANEMIMWRKIHSYSIPDDNHEAAINSYYDSEDIELEFDELSYYGNGEFGLPFNYLTTVGLTYYIYKADFYALDEEDLPSITDHNDHYFEAEEEREVIVTGMLKLKISTEVLAKISEPDALDGEVSIAIDSIDGVDLLKE